MNLFISSLGFGLVTASILAIGAIGFTLQFGVTNILNIAYGDLMTTGAFVAYICNRDAHLNIWISLVVASVCVAVLSMLLNRLLYSPFARRGTSLFGMIVVTIAVSLIIQDSLQAIFGPNFFSYQMSPGRTFHLGPMTFATNQIGIMVLAAILMIAIHLILQYTRLGKAMRAMAADPSLARDCGIATDRIADIAWLMSGALCGIAGVVVAVNVTSFDFATGNQLLIPLIAAAVLGGIGNAYGAMLGALTIGIVSELTAIFNPAYKNAVAFVILALVLLIRPQGILAEVAIQKEVVK